MFYEQRLINLHASTIPDVKEPGILTCSSLGEASFPNNGALSVELVVTVKLLRTHLYYYAAAPISRLV